MTGLSIIDACRSCPGNTLVCIPMREERSKTDHPTVHTHTHTHLSPSLPTWALAPSLALHSPLRSQMKTSLLYLNDWAVDRCESHRRFCRLGEQHKVQDLASEHEALQIKYYCNMLKYRRQSQQKYTHMTGSFTMYFRVMIILCFSLYSMSQYRSTATVVLVVLFNIVRPLSSIKSKRLGSAVH